MKVHTLVCFMSLGMCVVARPQSTLVVSTTPPASDTTPQIDESPVPEEEDQVFVDRLHIQSDIQFRYAKTVVETYVKNPSVSRSQEVDFEIVLPEKAFISNFTIETQGQTYVSRVEQKEEASKVYQEAVGSGQTAGLVDAREGNTFAVKTNVAAAEKLKFTLTYEQLLKRVRSRYEQVINLNPGQIVDNFEIKIHINESLPVINLNVPQLKQKSNEIAEDLEDNPIAVIRGENSSLVDITYKPSAQYQKELNQDGVKGQFVIQYDVDRKNQSSDIQVYDGYLVHFFVPNSDTEMLPKHVTFVLDTSGSMSGEKITQLQDAMVTILSNLNEYDHFSILEFDSDVTHWQSLAEQEAPTSSRPIYPASQSIIEQAIDYAVGLSAQGWTNINYALLEAVEVAKKAKDELKSNTLAIVIFLTDGQATVGETDASSIMENVKTSNNMSVPIYSLAFGNGADFELVKTISEENGAFARKIFEASDATIQLENFYAEISSPLLSNVTFHYVGENLQTAENVLPGSTFNSGSEFVSVVKLPDDHKLPESISVQGQGSITRREELVFPCFPIWPIPLRPVEDRLNSTTDRPLIGLEHISHGCIPPQPPKEKHKANFIERLWAFLTIEKLLDDKADNGNSTEEERKSKASDLSLQYNFVTDLTSLVVVKPAENDSANAQEEGITSLKPVPSLRSSSSPFGYSSYSSVAYSAGWPQQAATPLHIATNMHTGQRAASATPLHIAANMHTGSRRSGLPGPTRVHHYYLNGGMSYNYMPTTTTTYDPWSFAAMSYDNLSDVRLLRMDGEYSNNYDTSASMINSTALSCVPTDCKLELFPRTQFRGVSVTFTADSLDMADFDNKVESLKVTGNCDWTLYTEKDHQGVSQSFSNGDYKNAASLKKVLRKASSAKNDGCV